MPTGKAMFGCTRGRVALVAAVVAMVNTSAAASGLTPSTTPSTIAAQPPVSAAASTTTSTQPANHPSTTTTIPRPPPAMPAFTLPTNSGLQLLLGMQRAQAALKAAQLGLGPAQRGIVTAQRKLAAARKEVRRLEVVARQTQVKLDRTRTLLHQAAVEAYIHAGDAKLMTAIESYLNTNSIVDAGAQLHVLGTFGDNETQLLNEYLDLKNRVDAQLTEIRAVSDAAQRSLSAAQKRLRDLRKTINDSRTLMAVSLAGIHEFETAATSATSPILGPSRLTARQMADYIVSQHYRPNITVPIQVLAQIYLDEGAKTGVRGDVAFAQSILETGGFAHPGSSATNNNFAGIGWCDSCKHGFDFASARLGVRAQLQLMRIYVDPTFPGPAYKDPILLKGTLTLGFRGKVQTWWDLWGTWATAPLYGQRVYDIYERMVAFSRLDPSPPKPGLSAAKPAAPAANP
jgi:Mannosyl-glycoprotein endo-beta-N-acetylglucosaminidase